MFSKTGFIPLIESPYEDVSIIITTVIVIVCIFLIIKYSFSNVFCLILTTFVEKNNRSVVEKAHLLSKFESLYNTMQQLFQLYEQLF